MAEIKYQEIDRYIQDRSGRPLAPVYLVWGEGFLYQQAVKALVHAIIPDPEKLRHGYEVISQKQGGSMPDLIELLNTYSFFSEKKVIELRDATVFVTRENQGQLIRKVKRAYDNQDMKRAAALFSDLLGRLNLELEDITREAIAELFNIDPGETSGYNWMIELAAYCREIQPAAMDQANETEMLKAAVERGFPENNHLIISTDIVDKRLGLYKTIKKIGTVIDCSVARGSRKADRDEQRKFLFQQLKRVLAKHRKEMEPQAFEFMYDMIGFDLHGFENSLEKVIDYVGERQRITITDARSVLKRVREDPLYELTGAVCERNTQNALYYLSSLLSSGYHHLQLLAALTNQIRKLLVIKGFLRSTNGQPWHKGLDFGRFKTQVMPAIQEYDADLLEYIQACGCDGLGPSPKKPTTDLLIVKKSGNPYPVYRQFLQSENFSRVDLYAALEALNQADVKLKTHGREPRFVLEEVIFRICRR